MLKVQMEKADSLRKESHSTVEKLREEFDSLVREFMNYKKNDGKSSNKKTSKSYVPDMTAQNKQEIDRNMGDPGSYHKRHDGKKNHDEQEVADSKDKDKGSNPPFVPLLSLGKIQ
jgi:hypothetical protein